MLLVLIAAGYIHTSTYENPILLPSYSARQLETIVFRKNGCAYTQNNQKVAIYRLTSKKETTYKIRIVPLF